MAFDVSYFSPWVPVLGSGAFDQRKRYGSSTCCRTHKLVEFAAQRCGLADDHRAVGRAAINREEHMFNGKERLGLATLACVGLAFAISTTPAAAWDRGSVETFALIPSGFPMVEGLAVGPDGKVYSPTFNPTGSPPSQLFTFDAQGKLLASVPIQGSSQAMLGLEVIPGTTNALLVIDFGAHQVLAVNPVNGNASPCITLPKLPKQELA